MAEGAERAPVHHVAWLDARTLVTATGDGRILVRDAASRSVVASSASGGDVTALAVDPAAGWLAWGDDAGTVELRSSGGRRERTSMREAVDHLAWTDRSGVPMACLAVVAGRDVDVLAPGHGTLVADRLRPTSGRCAAWVRPGLLAVGGTGGVEFLGTAGTAPTTPDGLDPLPDLRSPGAVCCIEVDLDGRRLTVGDLRGEVRITSLQTGEELSLDGLGDRVHSCRWCWDGALLAVAVDDELTVWASVPFDLEPEPVCTVELGGLVTPIATPPDRRRLAVADVDGLVHVLSGGTTPRHVPIDTGSRPRCLAWSPDGTTLAVGTEDGLALLVP